MIKDEALKLALWHEAMAREPNRNQAKREKHEATAKFINEALAQEQEPVAYLSNKRQRINIEIKPQTFVEIPTVTDWEMPLYMKPPQRTWVGLTLTQVKLLWEGVQEEAVKSGDSLNWVFYTHINEALKEKNNECK